MQRMSAAEGDTCLFVADKQATVWRVLGEIRNTLGKRYGLAQPGERRFLWVTEFPMFEYDEGEKRWFSAHHPFTAPSDWTMGGENPDLSKLASRAYDLVLNGWELGSGSVRIHRSDVQKRVFSILGSARRSSGGSSASCSRPCPTGAAARGFAVGLDRLTAMTLGLDNIRDVVAFPKTTSAADLMCEAPSSVAPAQLKRSTSRPSCRRPPREIPEPRARPWRLEPHPTILHSRVTEK